MKKTLLVLGAGASKAVFEHFPTGLELIKDINSHLTTEEKITRPKDFTAIHLSALTNEVLRGLPHCSQSDIRVVKEHLWYYLRGYEYYARRFEAEGTPSIDYFIYNKIQENKLDEKSKAIAQYAIAYLLIGTEEALLRVIETQPNRLQNNWIQILTEKLKGLSVSDLNANLTIVSFNYERTFSYLFSEYTHWRPEEKNKFQSQIKYIYGSLGNLEEIPFGLKNDETEKMRSVYGNFKLIELDRPALNWTEQNFDTVIFLGFGYDNINLSKLSLESFPEALKVGTARGLDENLKRELEDRHKITFFESCDDVIKKHI
jgi:CDP-diacylglycerol pyrophosphatase